MDAQITQIRPASPEVVKHYQPEPRDLESTPYAMVDLNTGSQLAVWSLRKWLQIRRFPGKFDDQIFEAHSRINIPEAAESLEESLALLASSALRPVIIECPCKPYLSCDELTLLHTLRPLQSGHLEVAEKTINRLIPGRIARIFCRCANDYAMLLGKAGFTLNRIAKLRVIEK